MILKVFCAFTKKKNLILNVERFDVDERNVVHMEQDEVMRARELLLCQPNSIDRYKLVNDQ